MNHSRTAVAIAVLAGSMLSGGCNTFETRARQKAGVYQALPPSTQQRLKRGQISVGDSKDMVYIALGHPDEVRERKTAAGFQTVWIYRSYWQQYEGTEWVGWHRVIVPTRNGRGFVIFHEPVTADVYSTHADEVIRVVLENGVVASVSQRRR